MIKHNKACKGDDCRKAGDCALYREYLSKMHNKETDYIVPRKTTIVENDKNDSCNISLREECLDFKPNEL